MGQSVTVCGWVQMSRDMNHFAFVDLRDRYGITQAMLKKLGSRVEMKQLSYALPQIRKSMHTVQTVWTSPDLSGTGLAC